LRWLALLRGVNVGGARPLKMAELESAFRAAGARRAETVIQSGNVVFEADEIDKVAAAAAAAIKERLGFRPAVVLRSAQAWRAMVDANPFVASGSPETILHVACLGSAPKAGTAPPIEAEAVAPDEFVVAGDDVYLRLPNGVARANLTNARLDRAFRTVSRLRNWRTALRLLERLEA